LDGHYLSSDDLMNHGHLLGFALLSAYVIMGYSIHRYLSRALFNACVLPSTNLTLASIHEQSVLISAG